MPLPSEYPTLLPSPNRIRKIQGKDPSALSFNQIQRYESMAKAEYARPNSRIITVPNSRYVKETVSFIKHQLDTTQSRLLKEHEEALEQIGKVDPAAEIAGGSLGTGKNLSDSTYNSIQSYRSLARSPGKTNSRLITTYPERAWIESSEPTESTKAAVREQSEQRKLAQQRAFADTVVSVGPAISRARPITQEELIHRAAQHPSQRQVTATKIADKAMFSLAVQKLGSAKRGSVPDIEAILAKDPAVSGLSPKAPLGKMVASVGSPGMPTYLAPLLSAPTSPPKSIITSSANASVDVPPAWQTFGFEWSPERNRWMSPLEATGVHMARAAQTAPPETASVRSRRLWKLEQEMREERDQRDKVADELVSIQNLLATYQRAPPPKKFSDPKSSLQRGLGNSR